MERHVKVQHSHDRLSTPYSSAFSVSFLSSAAALANALPYMQGEQHSVLITGSQPSVPQLLQAMSGLPNVAMVDTPPWSPRQVTQIRKPPQQRIVPFSVSASV
jgi:hypothetical protein